MTTPEDSARNARNGMLDGLKREIREFVHRSMVHGAPESWVSRERDGYEFRLTATNTGTYQVTLNCKDLIFAGLLLTFLQETYGVSHIDPEASAERSSFGCICDFIPQKRA